MNTRLSRLCEAIIEAGWLAALIITPLFFNVFSSRVFEPDKLSLLRSIALVMAAAWLVKWVNEGFGRHRDATAAGEPSSIWARIWGTPLVLPTLILVAAYLISTIFSISPRISFWGSYQRLQGTYSTFSYILIFFLVLGHLRRREQWHRMIYAIILTSLPIAIYGILQRIGADPLPWGGNVVVRVAANMGNSIFVAAYLLMAFFLTLERTLVHFSRLLQEEENGSAIADAVLAGCFFFVLVVQGVTMLLLTQSRGPALGWAAGIYVFGLLLLLGLRGLAGRRERLNPVVRFLARWSWALWLGLAVVVFAGLVVFNLPDSPLAGLRDNPYIGRLGTALDLESRTARVRTLIWEGATELVPPHEPLEYPNTDGEGEITAMTPDRFNFLRPLIGYGPETMWVAFNRFYPPDLAHYEARNASPDRSHNETFDALVITGVLGFLAYMLLFLNVFYYSLKWLGLIGSRAQRWLFWIVSISGGIVGALLPLLTTGSWILSGLTGPTGVIGFLILFFITPMAIWNEAKKRPIRLGQREILIMALLATVIAHFAEIHFGIAIAATRTYFWTLSAVLVVVGMGWLNLAEPQAATEAAADTVRAAEPERSRGRRDRRRRRRPASQSPRAAASSGRRGRSWGEVLILAVILGVILYTLSYDFITAPNAPGLRDRNAFDTFFHALTSRVEGNQRIASLGVFWMVAFTWLIGIAVALAGLIRQGEGEPTGEWLVKAGALYSAVSGGIFLLFGLVQAATIAGDVRAQEVPAGLAPEQQLDLILALAYRIANHITYYYVLAFLLVVLLAVLIWRRRPGSAQWLGPGRWFGPVLGVTLSLGVVFFVSSVNINLVKADVIYKQGLAFDSARQYANSVALFEEAVARQPDEDYYYLFLGRARLEQARRAAGAEQLATLAQAEDALRTAQKLNPLNTDHTANLGRLYLSWAQLASTPEEREELLRKSQAYYQVATNLSPNAAHLYNEYGSTFEFVGENDRAMELYKVSQALDPEYADTYRRLGDLYRKLGEDALAIETLEQGLQIDEDNVQIHSILGVLYAEQGDTSRAIEHNLAVAAAQPEDLATLRNLAILYQSAGDYRTALTYAERALAAARQESQQQQIQALIQQLQQQLGG